MRVIVGVLIGAAFVAAMIYAVMAESQVECEVCVTYRGQTLCRTSVAVDRQHAISGAVSSASIPAAAVGPASPGSAPGSR